AGLYKRGCRVKTLSLFRRNGFVFFASSRCLRLPYTSRSDGRAAGAPALRFLQRWGIKAFNDHSPSSVVPPTQDYWFEVSLRSYAINLSRFWIGWSSSSVVRPPMWPKSRHIANTYSCSGKHCAISTSNFLTSLIDIRQ